MPGRQAADQKQIDQQIEIGRCCLDVNAEIAGELGRIQDSALMVGEHGPETAESFCGNTGAELRNVAFQVGPDEIQPPAHAVSLATGEQAFGKAAANPQARFPE